MLIKSRQRGMTLIETMISLTMGIFVLLGLTTFLSNSLNSDAGTLKMTRLNQEMRAIMMLMVRDVRRAGYWGTTSLTNGAIQGSGFGATYVNPFGTINTATAGCLLFSYDRDSDGAQSAGERYRFLLDSGAVMLTTGTGVASIDCVDPAPATTDALSDTRNTTITALTFVQTDSAPVFVTGTAGPNVRTRQIIITLTGQVKDDATVTKTLTETVKLENDLFSPT